VSIIRLIKKKSLIGLRSQTQKMLKKETSP